MYIFVANRCRTEKSNKNTLFILLCLSNNDSYIPLSLYTVQLEKFLSENPRLNYKTHYIPYYDDDPNPPCYVPDLSANHVNAGFTTS